MSKYLAMAMDPVHIGTGGYNIGRVDNVIVREPATNLPKIPGSSIAGTTRAYAAYQEVEKGTKDVTINCAGQDKQSSDEQEKGHCGKCIVCKSFGYSKKDDRGSRQGLIHFSDAQILLFPISTRLGPAWVTSPMILDDCGITLNTEEKPANDTIIVGSEFSKEPNLNLGWLNLPIDNSKKLNRSKFINLIKGKQELIINRMVVVPDNLFSHIVNLNLEVRTSVSIDPLTGAGIDGALFTSEAIPRSTIFWLDIDINNPKYFGYNDLRMEEVKSLIRSSSSLFETLGVGGMVTRGFGRLKIWEVLSNGK